MRKLLFTLFLAILFSSVGFAQKSALIKLKSANNSFEVSALKSTGFTMKSSMSELNLNPVSFEKGNFMSLENSNLIKIYDEGMPNIPVLSKLIEVPQGATVQLIVKSYDEEIINLSDFGITDKIQPALRSQSKSEDEVPFVIKEDVYKTDAYTNTKIAIYEDAGQMRATRLGRIEINPIQYNPAKNTLRVLNNLIVEVKFKNADFAKTEALKKKYASPYFNGVLEGAAINFNSDENKELFGATTIHMVIIADRMFEAQLAPYIAWKVKKGFNVTVGYTDVIGTTTTAIKTYLQNIYEGSDPMSFVLFVGDVQQIPAWPGNDTHITDLRYCEYNGDDIPEVYYGRFSAQTTAQLQPQIDKTLMYEKYEMSDPSYLEKTMLVTGDDADHEMTWGNGQMQYGVDYYFNAAHNIENSYYPQPGDNGAIHNSIITNMNAGLAFANYSAHCGPSGWSSPSFETNDVASLTNDEKYGLWIGNCCLSVKFDDNECFGEAALRKANGGAIGDIGGSNSTYWDEDYWFGVGLTSTISANPTYDESGRGAYDGVFHTEANESDISTWMTAQGQVVVCGNLANEASTSSIKQYYWEIYHLMGDPSLTNFIGTPQTMVVTPSPAALLLGMTSLNVSSAPYSYVALSQGGTLVATGLSDASGTANLTFASNALSIGSADLVVTAQNRVPYIGTISVNPADEPYIVLNSYTTSADPNFGEAITLNVTLENVANTGSGYDAANVSATISTTDPYVTITDDTESYGTIVAGATSLKDDAFAITIANNVPDQHVISFAMAITADGYSWNATLNLTANAPALSIANLTIANDNNADGTLDPGETGNLVFTVSNTGHADAVFNGTLSKASDPNNYLTLNATSVTGTSIVAGASADFSYSVTADATTPLGSPVSVKLDVADDGTGNYTESSTQEFNIGVIPIYPISDEGTLTVCTGTFYDSGLDTGDYGSSEDYTMTFLVPSGNDNVVVEFTEFDLESGYDYLHIYNGADVSAPEILGSPFSGTISPGTLMGANGLTFKFTSDGSVQRAGWAANVSCYTATTTPDCVTNPIPFNGATAVFPTQISWNASLGASSYDVYFGTDADPYTNTATTVTSTFMDITTAPNTTYYWAVLPTNSLGTTSGCEVFSFTTGDAQYNMSNTTVTTCNAVFYDTGGADNDYSSSEDLTMTFMPGETGKMISAYFNTFDVEISSGGTMYDYLEVYDGTDASATLIGKFSADDGAPVPTELQPVTASNTDGALTFVFHSDGSDTRDGWDASVTCTNPISIATYNNNGIEIYPNPNNGIFNINLSALNGEKVSVEITNISGKTIYANETASEMHKVDLRNNARGIYFVKISSEKGIANYKIVLQ